MPNIKSYQVMTQGMKEYFETNGFFNETAFEEIAAGKYEPKKNKDFKVWTSDAEPPANIVVDFNSICDEFQKSLKEPKTYKGCFGFDCDQEDRNFLSIYTTAPKTTVENDDIDLIQTLKEAMRTRDNTDSSSRVAILNQLSNPNIFNNLEDLKKLPGGVQKFLEQISFFKKQLQQANPNPSSEPSDGDEISSVMQGSEYCSNKENITTNSMVVPIISSNPFSETSIKTSSDRNLRLLQSRSGDVQAKRSLLQEVTSVTKLHSKPVTKNKITNQRMESFVKNFSFPNQKRRRSSTTPEESE